MAGFLRPLVGASQAPQQADAAKLKDVLQPAGTSGFDMADLQQNIGMGGTNQYTKPIKGVLSHGSDISGVGEAAPADFQAKRVDNHTRSPMSQTYFKRSN